MCVYGMGQGKIERERETMRMRTRVQKHVHTAYKHKCIHVWLPAFSHLLPYIVTYQLPCLLAYLLTHLLTAYFQEPGRAYVSLIT